MIFCNKKCKCNEKCFDKDVMELMEILLENQEHHFNNYHAMTALLVEMHGFLCRKFGFHCSKETMKKLMAPNAPSKRFREIQDSIIEKELKDKGLMEDDK